MLCTKYKFLYAVAILIGTIVGVGIFGIPYVVSQTGFPIGLAYLIALGIVMILLHLIYGEIVLRTPGKHRLVGYTEKYLGSWPKRIVSFSSIIGSQGALLAYIIVGGYFLSALFGKSDFFWSIIFFVCGALAIFLGIRVVASAELFMTILLILTMLFIFISGFKIIDLENLKTLDISNGFLPYGVILFSLAGLVAIPEMKEMLISRESKMKKAIFWGTFIPLILFILFTIVVVGATGRNTTQEALTGLQSVLGSEVILVGLIFGVLAIMTSFLTLGLNVEKILWYDFKIDKTWAWILACFIPFAGFLLGLRNFIDVVGVVGAVLGGIDAIIILLIFMKARKKGLRKPEYKLKISKAMIYVMMGIFMIGIVYQIFYLGG